MFKWLKKFTFGTAIRQLDQLEGPLADLIRKGQEGSNKIHADEFSKKIVDLVQKKACELAKLDPNEVLK